MKLNELLADRKSYHTYLADPKTRVMLGAVYFILGGAIGLMVNTMLAYIFHFFWIGLPLIMGIAAIGVVLALKRRAVNATYDYYYHTGDEVTLDIKEEGMTLTSPYDQEKYIWGKNIVVECKGQYYALLIGKRPALILNGSKLSQAECSWLMKASKKASVYKPVLDNDAALSKASLSKEEKDGEKLHYIEMSQKMYFRRYKAMSAIKPVIKIYLYMLLVTFLVGIILAANYIAALVIVSAVVAYKIIVRKMLISDYQKNKEKDQYYFGLKEDQGLIIKDWTGQTEVTWEQVKKIKETAQDFIIYLSDIHILLIPKHVLSSQECSVLHKKC